MTFVMLCKNANILLSLMKFVAKRKYIFFVMRGGGIALKGFTKLDKNEGCYEADRKA